MTTKKYQKKGRILFINFIDLEKDYNCWQEVFKMPWGYVVWKVIFLQGSKYLWALGGTD